MRKYFGYAFGEILLIVIGILIALNINNLNTARQQQIELTGFLEKIAKNMEQDIRTATQYKIDRDSIKVSSRAAVDLLVKGEFDIDIMLAAANCFIEFYFNANKSGYEALKSSGFLGKNKNLKLDSLMHHYYFIVERIEDEENGFNQFIESMEAQWVTSFSIGPMFQLMYSETLSREEMAGLFVELKSAFEHKAYEAAVARASIQDVSQELYDELIDTGNAFINEVYRTD